MFYSKICSIKFKLLFNKNRSQLIINESIQSKVLFVELSFNCTMYYNVLLFRTFPWNQETLLGYILESIHDCIIVVLFFFINAPIVLLFISICVHCQAFCKMFRDTTRKIDRAHTNENRTKLICQLVRFHTIVKEYVDFRSVEIPIVYF